MTYNPAYYARHRERILANNRRWLEENREKVRTHNAEYRVANRDLVLQRKRDYYRANREAIAAKAKVFAEEHREEIKRFQAAYYQANKERSREQRRRWRREHPGYDHKYWAAWYARRKNATVVGISRADLDAKWDYWGGRCWICGDEADTWDHVKPLNKGGAHMLVNLRPACRSCNSGKRDRWPFEVAA